MLHRVFHPEIRTHDLPLLESKMDAAEFREFIQQLETVIREIEVKRDTNRSKECEFDPLIGWRKKRFHSMKSPTGGIRADMRLIYKIEENTQELLLLTVGVRIKQKPTHPEDVYQRVKTRDQNIFK